MLKIALAIAANEKWRVENLDVTSAFLQGRDLESHATKRNMTGRAIMKTAKKGHMDYMMLDVSGSGTNGKHWGDNVR